MSALVPPPAQFETRRPSSTPLPDFQQPTPPKKQASFPQIVDPPPLTNCRSRQADGTSARDLLLTISFFFRSLFRGEGRSRPISSNLASDPRGLSFLEDPDHQPPSYGG